MLLNCVKIIQQLMHKSNIFNNRQEFEVQKFKSLFSRYKVKFLIILINYQGNFIHTSDKFSLILKVIVKIKKIVSLL